MTEKKQLSLCMVTKNDEKHLPACLENMDEVADEVIMIDLGSTDQTVDIAEKAGAKVYQRKWNEDNSEVKNACLDLAQGRWVLFLQANETIAEEQLKKLPLLLKNPNAEGYLLYIDQYSKKNKILSPVHSLRLFRNRKEYRYQYRIFERIPEEHLNNIKDAGIRIIQHTDQSLLNNNKKNKLLKDEMAKYPGDSYLHYMYGMELLNERRYEESVHFLESARKNVKNNYLFAPHLYKCLSWNLFSLKRYKEAFTILERGLKLFPAYTDFLVLRGDLYKQDKQYENAIRDLEQCLEIKRNPSVSIPKPEIHISVVLETLAEIHELIDNEQIALTYYQQAYELNHTNQKLLYKIGELAKLADKNEIVENIMKSAVEENNLEKIMILMDIYLQHHKYTQVIFYLDEIGSFLGNKEQVASIKFFCYMMMGKVKEAEVHFSMINKKSPIYEHVLLQRLESCWFYDDWEKAEQLLQEVNQRESINQHIKNLYHLLHNLFTGKVSGDSRKLQKQEYEMVSILIENLLWKEQEEKAKLVLPLLLQGQLGKEPYMKLAQLWAEKNDFDTIQILFKCVKHEHQLEFKQKIIQHLLRNNFISTANRVNKLGDSKSLGALDYVLWSRCFMYRLEKCIEKVQEPESVTEVHNTLSWKEKEKEKPNKALLAFYQNLSMKSRNSNEGIIECDVTDKTCAEIHSDIGEVFEKRREHKAAFTAYLRSLQWDPQNQHTQNKISNIFGNNQMDFSAFLEEKSWPLEGAVFREKEEYIHYVFGLIYFNKQQYEKAHAFFMEIQDSEMLSSIAQPYIFGCLWFSGNEEEVKKQISELNRDSHVVPAFLSICKDYILDKLAEGSQKHKNSELIKEEQEKVRKMVSARTFFI
ncbi:glycosyltransferase [Gracilibacillus sp. YIM 98692]|uniref:glycosyltransferase n=1 Tax=Gracilibacillus sp. YIM 98692 TaxID=2663532 RepID=UPI0013D7BD8E|nr:glycosyltransferase [Gracilibacillus sp. YIM 98692]